MVLEQGFGNIQSCNLWFDSNAECDFLEDRIVKIIELLLGIDFVNDRSVLWDLVAEMEFLCDTAGFCTEIIDHSISWLARVLEGFGDAEEKVVVCFFGDHFDANALLDEDFGAGKITRGALLYWGRAYTGGYD